MKIPVLTILLLAVGLAACGDNPVENHEDEHAEAHGLQIELGDVVVYRVLEGVVTCEIDPCGITVAEGEQTAVMTVEFLAEDGDVIHAEDLDEDFSLGFEIADPSIAAFEKEGEWSFRIQGESAGETKFRLMLMHLGEHEDFTSPPLTQSESITIRVTDEGS